MADDRGVQIIALRDRERNEQAAFLSLYQAAADLTRARGNSITSLRQPGEDISLRYYDGTGIQDAQELASGLTTTMLPIGQAFFAMEDASDDEANAKKHDEYLAKAAEVVHREMFSCNFSLNINEVVGEQSNLGTGCIFAEFDRNLRKLNYRNYDVGSYQIQENVRGRVDAIILSFEYTARQAIQEYGEDKVSDDIKKAAAEVKTESDAFPFVWIVRPNEVNPIGNGRFKWESLHVDEKAKTIVREGGYDTFPFAVGRWSKSGRDKYGYGQGMVALGFLRMLQAQRKTHIKMAHRQAEPPLEAVADDIEGIPDVRPNAVNWVVRRNSFGSIDQNALGNFVITDQTLKDDRETIHEIFYRDVFVMFGDLKGDRRTTIEIRARAQEGLRRLSQPVARLQEELLNPIIERTINLLIQWGRIPPPPPTLLEYNIVYLGQLALALRDQQATGAMQYVSVLGEMMPFYPDAMDVVDFDAMLPDLARSMGVKEAHIATPDEIAAKRQARAQQQQAAMAMQAAQAAGKAYGPMSKAPEQGSPVGEMMGASR